VAEALAQARGRGCRVAQVSVGTRADDAATVLLVVDDQEGMVGTLAPADRAQAVASANPGFVAALARGVTPPLALQLARGAEPAKATQPLDWLDWEQSKQRRLLGVQPENRIA
jgi:hypothetical protein